MSPGPDRLAAAQQTLADLGVTVADLQHQGSSPAPTFGEYLPIVVAAAGRGASCTYGTYWARMATTWADRCLDEVHASDIEAMKNTAHWMRHTTSPGSNGISATGWPVPTRATLTAPGRSPLPTSRPACKRSPPPWPS